MMIRRVLPDPVSGYEQTQYRVSVLRARAATNLVANPSFESSTTGYTVSGSMARVATHQRRGAYSLQVTPTSATGSGLFYGTVSLTAGTLYYFSVDFLGEAGIAYRIYFADTSGNRVGPDFRFRGTGHWRRHFVSYMETTTTTRRLYIVKDLRSPSANTRPYYVDGLQVEADRLTTYLDGSLRGFVRSQTAYYWTGQPHASASVRVATTRHGGEEMDLRKLGFHILSIIGLGLGGFANVTLPNARGGATYHRTVKQESTFDLVGALLANSDDPHDVERQAAQIESVLRPKAALIQQPVVLRFQHLDNCGEAAGEPVDVPCLYEGGLEGAWDNVAQERLTLTFTINLPYVARLDGTAGASLGYDSSFTANQAARRVNGQWLPLGTGFAGGGATEVLAIQYDHNRQRVYFGGDFDSAGGVSCADICYWDIATQTFVAMDAGTNGGVVHALALAPNGDVWVAGSFTAIGSGGAACKGLARWNVATGTWTAFNPSTASFTEVMAVAVGPTGIVYIGGNFTDWSTANGDRIVQYDGASFAALSTGVGGVFTYIQAITIGRDGRVYVGGDFATIGGVSAVDVAVWDPSTSAFAALSTGLPGTVYSLATGLGGEIYAGGNFSGAVKVWNGSVWTTLGDGLGATVEDIAIAPNGIVYLSGQFSSAGGVTLPDRMAGWNGSAYFPLDVDLPSSGAVRAIEAVGDDLYIGFDSSGTAIGAELTTVTNPGSADAYGTYTFTGPGQIHQLKNYTTGDALYFNLTLNAGETAVLTLEPGNISFGSNFRPNLLGSILPGSSLSSFYLAPGDNTISLLISGGTAATAATVEFAPNYDSLRQTLYP